jgi:hypothetical protein
MKIAMAYPCVNDVFNTKEWNNYFEQVNKDKYKIN